MKRSHIVERVTLSIVACFVATSVQAAAGGGVPLQNIRYLQYWPPETKQAIEVLTGEFMKLQLEKRALEMYERPKIEELRKSLAEKEALIVTHRQKLEVMERETVLGAVAVYDQEQTLKARDEALLQQKRAVVKDVAYVIGGMRRLGFPPEDGGGAAAAAVGLGLQHSPIPAVIVAAPAMLQVPFSVHPKPRARSAAPDQRSSAGEASLASASVMQRPRTPPASSTALAAVREVAGGPRGNLKALRPGQKKVEDDH